MTQLIRSADKDRRNGSVASVFWEDTLQAQLIGRTAAISHAFGHRNFP